MAQFEVEEFEPLPTGKKGTGVNFFQVFSWEAVMIVAAWQEGADEGRRMGSGRTESVMMALLELCIHCCCCC